jgi:hypothetical protein
MRDKLSKNIEGEGQYQVLERKNLLFIPHNTFPTESKKTSSLIYILGKKTEAACSGEFSFKQINC